MVMLVTLEGLQESTVATVAFDKVIRLEQTCNG